MRKSAFQIATEIADALERVSDPALRYVACQKIVAHAINQDRTRAPASTKKEVYQLGLVAEYFRREKKDAAAASLLAKAAHRIQELLKSNSRLRAKFEARQRGDTFGRYVNEMLRRAADEEPVTSEQREDS